MAKNKRFGTFCYEQKLFWGCWEHFLGVFWLKSQDGRQHVLVYTSVHINCIYTKNEIDKLLSDVTASLSEEKDSYLSLKESDQLYLYKPSSVSQTSEYYVMSWDIDPDYNIPLQTNFVFKDYLFGHTWSLIWDGNAWTGNNVVNLSFAKQSTYCNNNGRPGLIIQHTDYMAKWMACFEDTLQLNYATQLAKYVTNWRVMYNDGTITDLADAEVTLSEAPQYIINNINCDVQQWYVRPPSSIKKDGMLYLMADINIDGYVTPLKWDLHPSSAINAGMLATWNDNPVIESLAYVREVKHSNKIIEPSQRKNIHIYIEKKYFEQLPSTADETYSPFEVMVIQQFYEVQPDPRNCSTLTTDYNIHSSKIIWADNIMTMQRDLNVVGGTVDVLAYDYTVLKAIINGIQEQLRLQAAYNEYTDSIRKGLEVAGNILKILDGTVSLLSDVSNMSVTGDDMTVQTYRTEEFHFPGFGGGGGGDYPDKGLSGKFMLDMDASAGNQILRRFIPTETTIPATTSNLSATSLVFQAIDALTQIGDATTTIAAGGLTFDRLPTIVDNTRTIIQSVQTLTDTARELRRRWRERNGNTITDHETTNEDEMELDDLSDDDDDITQEPYSMITHSTTTNATSSDVNESNTLFGDYTLESFSDLTNEQLLALTYDDIDIRQIGNTIVVSRVSTHKTIYVRRVDRVRTVITADYVRLYSQRHVIVHV
ncbi:hypothetical protein M9Y10_029881 [Tritrichomonas musculus]|uniref:Uncharacterized protein n=1 Tax=Tritrichomonas musculus TaxID=1915356 RepID=A0ABR2KNC3_9EUKA